MFASFICSYMGIELLSIRKFRIRKRLDVVHGFRGVIYIYIGGNSIRNGDGTFERSNVLLKKYKEFLIRVKEIENKVCVSRILPRLGENEEWWLRALGVNERVHGYVRV